MTTRLSGILPVEKGPGVTSFQVVAHVRRVLRVQKVGHGGTLDPDATGVLPILIGEATKLTPYLVDFDKEYVATVRLGITTDTEDLSGRIVETRPVPPLEREAIERTLAGFVGVIRQVPPMYSALHRGGKRLYELAREGVTVEREPREIRIHALALERAALPDLTVRVRCGKGAYIRTLAADIGAALGCGAALASLVRTRVGPYELAGCVRWHELRDLRTGAPLRDRLLPLDSALASLRAVTLDARQAEAFSHGQAVAAPPDGAGTVRVYGPAGTLLGIGLCRGPLVKPDRLLHADPPRTPVVST